MLVSPRFPLDALRLVLDAQTHNQLLHTGPIIDNEPPHGRSRRVNTSTNANPASELKSNVRLKVRNYSQLHWAQAGNRERERERHCPAVSDMVQLPTNIS